MKTVTLKEYEEAKGEIINGVEYKENTRILEDGRISKSYATEKNGVFYEITCNGITEFWSDKHSESRRFDGRSREEIISQYEEKLQCKSDEIISLEKKCNDYLNGMNENASLLINARMKIKELEEKLANAKKVMSTINALSYEAEVAA